MKVKITLNQQAIKNLEQAVQKSAFYAMEAMHTDLNTIEKTMPVDTGDMQNNQTFVAVEGEDIINGKEIYSVSLITGSPQARRLYYHPEYNFQVGKNTNACAYWLDPYINGSKKDFVKVKFIEEFKRRTGV